MGVNQRSQIVMSEAEITEIVERSRTATLATTVEMLQVQA